jgi:DNA replication initiation complex subunit (GINS family)
MRETRAAGGDSAKVENLERMRGRFRDILESRIGKITRLASSEVTSQTRALQPEESALYKDLFARISSWRRSMKKLGDKS